MEALISSKMCIRDRACMAWSEAFRSMESFSPQWGHSMPPDNRSGTVSYTHLPGDSPGDGQTLAVMKKIFRDLGMLVCLPLHAAAWGDMADNGIECSVVMEKTCLLYTSRCV